MMALEVGVTMAQTEVCTTALAEGSMMVLEEVCMTALEADSMTDPAVACMTAHALSHIEVTSHRGQFLFRFLSSGV